MIGSKSGMKKLPAPLFIPTLGFGLGIVIQAYVGVPYILGIAVPLLIITILTKNRLIPLLLLIMASGSLSYDIQIQRVSNPLEDYLMFTKKNVEYIEGYVTNKKTNVLGNNEYEVQTNSTNIFPFSVKLKLYSRDDILSIGDLFTSKIELELYETSMNPGQFDYAEYMRNKGIHGKGSFIGKTIVNSTKFSIPIYINILRRRVLRVINVKFQGTHGFVKAILLGERSELFETKDLFKQAGIMHLLAISGLHVGIIYLFIFTLLRLVLPKRLTILLANIVILGFWMLCYNSPSVTRAVIMILVVSIAKLLERDIGILQLLSTAALVILAVNPLELFNVGFQLSFIAVYSILVVSPCLRLINPHEENKYKKHLLNPVIVTICVNIFLLPIILYYFHEAPIVGILSSVPAILVFSFYLPVTLLILLIPFSGISNFLLPVSEIAQELLLYVSNLAGRFPFKLNFIIVPTLIIALYWLIILLVPIIKKKVVLVILFICFTVAFILSNIWTRDKFEIISFAVGHGDCHLIRNNDDITLIDLGDFRYSTSAFERHVLPYLKAEGLSRINRLIITHQHNDHYGGLLPLLLECDVDEIIISNNFAKSRLYKHWQEVESILTDMKHTIVIDTLSIREGDLTLTLINPADNPREFSANNQSLLAKVEFNDLSMLFTGDLEIEGEVEVLQKYREYLRSDVLKAGHHGAKNTLCYEFLNAVAPHLVIIPVNQKGYSVLSDKTLNKLCACEIETYITGSDGAITIKQYEDSFRAKSYYSGNEVTVSIISP